jgi:hypothetical protein
MPRILVNPSSVQCPDYNLLDIFQDTCAPLINNTTTHDQAAIILTNIWNVGNAPEKVIWQAQIEADKEEAHALYQQEAAACLLREAEAAKEKEDLYKEERNKNLTKFVPIPNRPVPQYTPIITAQSTTGQMDKGDCIPLWYYTNKGLKNALST